MKHFQMGAGKWCENFSVDSWFEICMMVTYYYLICNLKNPYTVEWPSYFFFPAGSYEVTVQSRESTVTELLKVRILGSRIPDILKENSGLFLLRPLIFLVASRNVRNFPQKCPGSQIPGSCLLEALLFSWLPREGVESTHPMENQLPSV